MTSQIKPPVASYCRRGYTMSRRARISHNNNEHPITHWMTKLALEKEPLLKMLVCIGVHHTGLYAKRTLFYRLPRLNNDKELARFAREFNSISPSKKKFTNYMSAYLQENTRIISNSKLKPNRIRLSEIFNYHDNLQEK